MPFVVVPAAETDHGARCKVHANEKKVERYKTIRAE